MKKIIFGLLLSIGSFTGIGQTTFKADPYHSKLGFTVTHLGIADVTGFFEKFDVSVISSKSDFSDAVIEMTADINSINTLIEPRDKHLKSADFFDVEKYPSMTFKSSGLKKVAENKYKVSGNLTLHGVTKAITVDMLFRGTTTNPANKAQASGLQITGLIKRSDFGIGGKFPGAMISDEVSIKADGEFGKL